MRGENKQTIILMEPVLFDYQWIRKITFDLIHINEGWDDERHDYAYRGRSSYSAEDIIDFFEQFKYFSVEWSLGINKNEIKIKGTYCYRYYWETTDEEGCSVRIILDLPRQQTGEGIIVTVFKI